ncbi:sensor histidine kinase [Paraburkholderia sp. BCC1885]|uniref:sensor histidine kinase n=1 Tax=Paraburkholderia sp. BCC1885 TaxID=2562669 RepID=UPI001183DF3E|nr:HAMP domain-containing sensor histidine kinase [Paraburkholderia sp. BCC1885]
MRNTGTFSGTFSISRRISIGLFAAQAIIALASGFVMFAYLLRWHLAGHLLQNSAIDTIAAAVIRAGDGQLHGIDTPGIVRLKRAAPDLWFVIQDGKGHLLKYGQVTPACVSVVELAPQILAADVTDPREEHNLSCHIDTVKTPAGALHVAFGGGPLEPSWKRVGLAVIDYLELPFFVPLLIANFILIPIVVGGAHRKLKRIASLAQHIDIDRPGLRMPADDLPREVAPIVTAFNAALERLDGGRRQQERFIANAAHELRTPIAIIRARLDSLDTGPVKAKLEQDVERLGNLGDQLLDLQRLKSVDLNMAPVDLVELAAETLAELAPLAISAGHKLELVSHEERLDVLGDVTPLKRVIINLMQNAMQHGGEAVSVTVKVYADAANAVLEVIDNGPGIPHGFRERIFESFSRYARTTSGAGLGLSLVREIVVLHGGDVSIFDPGQTGAAVRVRIPRRMQPL